MHVRRAHPSDADACVDALAALPDYFTESTHDEVRGVIEQSSSREHAAYVADDDGAIVGFLLIERTYRRAAEILYIAVQPEHRSGGVGSKLLEAALDELSVDGVALVEAKTLDAGAGYEPYVATRAFWERRGFVQIDCIDPLPGWDPGNPSAIYVKALAAT